LAVMIVALLILVPAIARGFEPCGKCLGSAGN
jgi:hypothetical protein